MNPTAQPGIHQLQLALSPNTGVEFLRAVADVIRTLPGVQRVQVDTDRRELAVVSGLSAHDLLQQIHQALVLVRTEPAVECAA